MFLRRLLRTGITLLVFFSFFASVGGHLLLVQTVAWAKMSYVFHQKESLKVSLKKTFDGKHPCEMCKHLKKVKTDESKKLPLPPSLEKDDLWVSSDLIRVNFAYFKIPYALPGVKNIPFLAFSPPVPPPQKNSV